VPNRVTAAAKVACVELVDDPVYRARLARDLRLRKVAPAIEAMLWYYAKGKPKEIIEHQGDLPLTVLPDAELRARMAALLEKL
jgi:hypothetical protein